MSNSNFILTNYRPTLIVKDKNFTQYVESISLEVSQDSFMEKIAISLHMSKNQYDREFLPNKNSITLKIESSKGGDIADIDGSFAYNLSVISESRDMTTTSLNDDVPSLGHFSIICVPQSIMNPLNKLIIDKCFYKKTRKNMLDEILGDSGAQYEIQSEILDPSDIIEQCFIPPVRVINAIRHIDHYFRLFKDGAPTYINFALDGKLYIGSCIKNNLKPLSVYLGGDHKAWEQANSTRASGEDKYNYTILFSDADRDYAMALALTGVKQNYTYNPLNKLYSRITKSANQYTDIKMLSNIYGNSLESFTAIKKMNNKETWMYKHNGLPLENTGDADKNFSNSYMSSIVSRSTILSGELEGMIRFDDILKVGRLVKISSPMNKSDFSGDYYMDSVSFVLTPQKTKTYWIGKAFVVLKSGFNLGNL